MYHFYSKGPLLHGVGSMCLVLRVQRVAPLPHLLHFIAIQLSRKNYSFLSGLSLLLITILLACFMSINRMYFTMALCGRDAITHHIHKLST